MKYKVGDIVYQKPFMRSKYLIKCEVISINDNVIGLKQEGESSTSNFVLDNYWGGKLLTKAEYFKIELDKTLKKAK